jgi:hypothetical protein
MHFFVAFFLSHWIFDFLLQSDKMALNKSKSFVWLSIHSAIYALGVATFLLFFGAVPNLLIPFIILFVSHFVIDGITSRINAILWEKKERHWFFVSIGFDQMLHYAVLLYLLSYCYHL